MDKHQFQSIRKKPSGGALEEFMLLDGRYSNFTKETYFIRYLSKFSYDKDAAKLRAWHSQSAERKLGCVFAPTLQSQLPAEAVGRYKALYDNGSIRFPFSFQNRIWQEALEREFAQILALFQKVRGRSEDSIVRNFAVKLLYWMELYFPVLFVETEKMNRFPKFACGGTVKLAEYLFLCLLFRMGCDVLYISPAGDVLVENEELLSLSVRLEEEPPRPAGRGGEQRTPQTAQPAPQSSGRAVISLDRIRRAERDSRSPAPAAPAPRPPVTNGSGSVRQPLEFEELAKFASSVVMLKVFDENDQCFKTGSGVIISSKGYVLTNLHVVSGGRYYGILLEEETDIFYTNELIKYHQDYDLAILRMEKYRKPIPVSRGEKGLVRGQKVVAIGSPLGLFNSVSDGIISGFRDMGKVSMIQFTAPVSHGSSGGALLDMFGNLIGLITAGFDDGQNLNLAVDYQTILQFARGLL